MTSSPPCWLTKTKDLSLASFVRPPEVVHFSIVIGVPRGWLKTSYCLNAKKSDFVTFRPMQKKLNYQICLKIQDNKMNAVTALENKDYVKFSWGPN